MLAVTLRPCAPSAPPALPPTLACAVSSAVADPQDYHLVEKLAQFDRERIPERVVHARGAAAKGFFEVRGACIGFSTVASLCARIC